MVLSSVSNPERATIMKRERIDLMSTNLDDLCDDKEKTRIIEAMLVVIRSRRRMTMLLMMFLTRWLWQVDKCQQC